MARPKAPQQQEKATYDQDWSDENQDRCPGYRYMAYEIAGEPYQTMIRCELTHPHQYVIKQPGNERVPLYPYIKDLATEREARWAIKRRQGQAEKKRVGRDEGAKGLRAILDEVRGTHEDEEAHGGQVVSGKPGKRDPVGAAPESGHRAALTPLAEDIPPDVEDWLASIPSKPADDRDDDIPLV